MVVVLLPILLKMVVPRAPQQPVAAEAMQTPAARDPLAQGKLVFWTLLLVTSRPTQAQGHVSHRARLRLVNFPMQVHCLSMDDHFLLLQKAFVVHGRRIDFFRALSTIHAIQNLN
jgi:hypothetical protein